MMTCRMRFKFPLSHAFNGGRLAVDDDGAPGQECMVEFGDGSAAIGAFAAAGDAYDLAVPEYRTAKGTIVRARNWKLVRSSDGTWRSRRAPPAS